MRFSWRWSDPLQSSQSPRPCWPLCLFAAALIHPHLIPTKQQVCDLVTWLFVRKSFSDQHGNWFILPPITHPLRVFDWPELPRKREKVRAKDYGDEKRPRRERQSKLSNFTDEGKACWICHNSKLLLCSSKLSVKSVDSFFFQSFLCFVDFKPFQLFSDAFNKLWNGQEADILPSQSRYLILCILFLLIIKLQLFFE